MGPGYNMILCLTDLVERQNKTFLISVIYRVVYNVVNSPKQQKHKILVHMERGFSALEAKTTQGSSWVRNSFHTNAQRLDAVVNILHVLISYQCYPAALRTFLHRMLMDVIPVLQRGQAFRV